MDTRWLIGGIVSAVAVVGYAAFNDISRDRADALPGTDHSMWKTFTPQDGSFTILFPRTPRHTSILQDDPFGKSQKKIGYRVYFSTDRDGAGYFVKAYLYPELPSDKEVLLEAVTKKMLGSIPHSKLVGCTKFDEKEMPGRDIEIENHTFIIKSRLFFSKNRLYELTVVEQKRAHLADDFHDFVHSFHIYS